MVGVKFKKSAGKREKESDSIHATLTAPELKIIENSGLSSRQIIATKLLVASRRSEKPIMRGEIIRKAGYSEATTTKPNQVFNIPKVKAVLNQIVGNLDTVADKIAASLAGKEWQNEDVSKQAYVLDKVVKNRQLLSGGTTENTELKITWE